MYRCHCAQGSSARICPQICSTIFGSFKQDERVYACFRLILPLLNFAVELRCLGKWRGGQFGNSVQAVRTGRPGSRATVFMTAAQCILLSSGQGPALPLPLHWLGSALLRAGFAPDGLGSGRLQPLRAPLPRPAKPLEPGNENLE